MLRLDAAAIPLAHESPRRCRLSWTAFSCSACRLIRYFRLYAGVSLMLLPFQRYATFDDFIAMRVYGAMFR